MPKFEVDGMKNIVIRNETSVMIITAYDPNRLAIRVGFSYLPIRMMIDCINFLFENEKEILECLVKAEKIKKLESSYRINNICFFYCGSAVLINRNDNKYEVRHKLLIAEQGN